MRVKTLALLFSCLALSSASSSTSNADQLQRLRGQSAPAAANKQLPFSIKPKPEEDVPPPGTMHPDYCKDLWSADDKGLTEHSEFPLEVRGGAAVGGLQSCAKQSNWNTGAEPRKIGTGGYGQVFELTDGPSKRAAKCVHTANNKPRREICAQLQANRGAGGDEEKIIAPEVFDAWKCDLEGRAGGATCIEMEYIAEAGERFENKLSESLGAALSYQREVFKKMELAVERGVSHNDVHHKNIGVFGNGHAAVFDWGRADVCRTTIPDFLQPLAYARTLYIWSQGIEGSPQSLISDIELQLRLLFRGEHATYSSIAPIRTTNERHDAFPAVTAALQARAAKDQFPFDDREKPINALLIELARHGRTVYRPERVEVVLAYPLHAEGKHGVPVVKSWRLEGMVNSWAADETAAREKLAEVEKTECKMADHWLTLLSDMVWMIQGNGQEGTFTVENPDTDVDGTVLKKIVWNRGEGGGRGILDDDIDFDIDFHVVPKALKARRADVPKELQPEGKDGGVEELVM